MPYFHTENHRNQHASWLRATVLGANDGIISLACLIIGMASGGAATHNIGLAAIAGLLAGALSMAAGEYVSVRSQADTEAADIAKETQELLEEPERELLELKGIYKSRGLSSELALEVATALTAHNALETPLRDELGMVEAQMANPIQAALASAASFALGALVPGLCILLAPPHLLVTITPLASLLCLYALGAGAAKIGGAPWFVAANRVLIWGAGAMAITAGAGYLFGAA